MFDWEFAFSIMPQLLSALRITVAATVTGMAAALVVGLVLAIMRRSRVAVVSWTAAVLVEFIRSTPLLVQLYFIFYALPALGITLGPFAAGVITLGLHYGAYCAEVYRAGIEDVPRGQWEAAVALNLSRADLWRFVILPQAVPRVVPALGNYFVALFKETPLLSAITLVEVLQTAKIIGSESFRYVEPFTMVGVLFLVLSLLAAGVVRWTERRLKVRHA